MASNDNSLNATSLANSNAVQASINASVASASSNSANTSNNSSNNTSSFNSGNVNINNNVPSNSAINANVNTTVNGSNVGNSNGPVSALGSNPFHSSVDNPYVNPNSTNTANSNNSNTNSGASLSPLSAYASSIASNPGFSQSSYADFGGTIDNVPTRVINGSVVPFNPDSFGDGVKAPSYANESDAVQALAGNQDVNQPGYVLPAWGRTGNASLDDAVGHEMAKILQGSDASQSSDASSDANSDGSDAGSDSSDSANSSDSSNSSNGSDAGSASTNNSNTPQTSASAPSNANVGSATPTVSLTNSQVAELPTSAKASKTKAGKGAKANKPKTGQAATTQKGQIKGTNKQANSVGTKDGANTPLYAKSIKAEKVVGKDGKSHYEFKLDAKSRADLDKSQYGGRYLNNSGSNKSHSQTISRKDLNAILKVNGYKPFTDKQIDSAIKNKQPLVNGKNNVAFNASVSKGKDANHNTINTKSIKPATKKFDYKSERKLEVAKAASQAHPFAANHTQAKTQKNQAKAAAKQAAKPKKEHKEKKKEAKKQAGPSI